ncbi:FixH family protein [Macrococcus equipercicus]|uniref:FixH family protein n=1 Tax=Macrococcus equipercicus TaxID=69967 RepID=A0ABQ6RB51_9STAP|nr:FixH family protein [Macrococcus equipercicus]KAA1042436.1 FixH family protein [Macrococcus equipercicus]
MKKFLLTAGALLFLTACSNEQGHAGHGSTATNDKLEPLKVALAVPKSASAGDKISLKAKVTYGKESVDKADEVMFEIIKDNNAKSSVKEKVEHGEDGVYTLDYTFKEPGKYRVISHVTAKNQHTMPDADIVVSK